VKCARQVRPGAYTQHYSCVCCSKGRCRGPAAKLQPRQGITQARPCHSPGCNELYQQTLHARRLSVSLHCRTSPLCRYSTAIILSGCSRDPAAAADHTCCIASTPELCRYSAAIALLGASEDPALLRLLITPGASLQPPKLCRYSAAIALLGASEDPALLRLLITPGASLQPLELCRYSAAIALLGASEDPALLRLLLSNRSAAQLEAGRQLAALDDAAAAVKLAPGWAKGHWRRGRSLAALQRYVGGWQSCLVYVVSCVGSCLL
jgi:hypothetical protein